MTVALETARDREIALEIALERAYPNAFVHVADWDEEFVYFTREGEPGLRRRGYAEDAEGNVTLGETEERVRPRRAYAPAARGARQMHESRHQRVQVRTGRLAITGERRTGDGPISDAEWRRMVPQISAAIREHAAARAAAAAAEAADFAQITPHEWWGKPLAGRPLAGAPPRDPVARALLGANRDDFAPIADLALGQAAPIRRGSGLRRVSASAEPLEVRSMDAKEVNVLRGDVERFNQALSQFVARLGEMVSQWAPLERRRLELGVADLAVVDPAAAKQLHDLAGKLLAKASPQQEQ